MLPILTLGNKEQEGAPAYPTHQVPAQECGQWEEDGAGAQRCETETPAGRAVGEAGPAPGVVAQNGLSICHLFLDLQ